VIARVTLVGAVVSGALAVLAGSAAGGRASTPSDYPSCGSYWNRNTPVSTREGRVNRCIVRAARDGRRARAVAALTTVEGDPIVQYVFVRGEQDVLVVIDSTRDAFAGPVGWIRLRCTRLLVSDRRLGWAGCRQTGTGKPPWLVRSRVTG
jgi:hypothetical protein